MFTDVEVFEAALAASGLSPVRSARGATGRFRADLSISDLGPLRFIDRVTPEGECFREARHAGSDDEKYWQLDLMTRGRAHVEQGGRSTALGPSDLILIDPARPVRYASSPAAHLTLLIPRERLRLGSAEATRLLGTRICTTCGPGALAGPLVQDMARTMSGIDARFADRSAAAVSELISVAIDSQLGLSRSAPDDALRDRVVGYIEARLSDVDLCPAKIASAHHLSVRRLHRLFEDQPLTLMALIRTRRLERCHTDLVRGDLPVAVVAARWGFTDPAHFSRLFKRAYGHNAAALMSKNPTRMVNASTAGPRQGGPHERTRDHDRSAW